MNWLVLVLIAGAYVTVLLGRVRRSRGWPTPRPLPAGVRVVGLAGYPTPPGADEELAGGDVGDQGDGPVTADVRVVVAHGASNTMRVVTSRLGQRIADEDPVGGVP